MPVENNIRFTLLNDLSNKESKFYVNNIDKLHKKLQIMDEIEWLRFMERDKGWSVNERILLLSAELLKVEDSEVDTQTILDQEHETNDDLLLEIVLANMRQETLTFKKNVTKRKN